MLTSISKDLGKACKVGLNMHLNLIYTIMILRKHLLYTYAKIPSPPFRTANRFQFWKINSKAPICSANG